MRLDKSEMQVIHDVVTSRDQEAAIYLFSPRMDDYAPGGYIDLLVLSKKIDLMAKLDILAELHQRLGEQKIYLIVYPDQSSPFARMVIESGVRL